FGEHLERRIEDPSSLVADERPPPPSLRQRSPGPRDVGVDSDRPRPALPRSRNIGMNVHSVITYAATRRLSTHSAQPHRWHVRSSCVTPGCRSSCLTPGYAAGVSRRGPRLVFHAGVRSSRFSQVRSSRFAGPPLAFLAGPQLAFLAGPQPALTPRSTPAQVSRRSALAFPTVRISRFTPRLRCELAARMAPRLAEVRYSAVRSSSRYSTLP